MKSLNNLCAVILAAGKSSRFYPFSKDHHKSLFPLMGKTIIEYTVESVKKAGINEIILVVQSENDFREVLGDGEKFGVRLNYCLQPEALGMGDALLRAKDFIHGDFFLLSGHRIDFSEHAQNMQEKKEEAECVVLVKETNDISKYGSVKLDGDRVISVIEKPELTEINNGFRLLSTYLLSKEFISELESTPITHYRFEVALSAYSQKKNVRAVRIDDESFSLKYPWDLLEIKNYIFKGMRKKVSPHAQIADTAKVMGEVIIEEGAKIMEYAVIKGPCYIGKNAVVGDFTLIRNGSVLEDDVAIGVFSEVKNTLIQKNTHIHSGYIGDSVIGQAGRIGGSVSTSNRRLDRQIIYSEINGLKVSTNKTSLGVVLGDNCHTGANVCFMPGVIVGSNSVIGPSTTVMSNVEDDTLFYTEFANIVKKRKNG